MDRPINVSCVPIGSVQRRLESLPIDLISRPRRAGKFSLHPAVVEGMLFQIEQSKDMLRIFRAEALQY